MEELGKNPINVSAADDGPSKRLMRWGAGISIAYFAFLAVMAGVAWQKLFCLDPNEFGDMLAGVFSPLAFLWLVLGFMQQGEELRQSSRALWLQGEELRNSVEQQRHLVETARDQLEFERAASLKREEEALRAALPTLILTYRNSDRVAQGIEHYLSITNSGTKCSHVAVKAQNRITSAPKLDGDLRLDFSVILPPDVETVVPVEVQFRDRNARHMCHRFNFRLTPVPSGLKHAVEDLGATAVHPPELDSNE